jgi:CHAT domain-containing protein
VSSIAHLRLFPQRPGVGREAFVGFGDPALPEQAAASPEALGPVSAAPQPAPLAALRRLPRIPRTGPQLLRMADDLGGDASQVYLQAQATEDRLRELSASGRLKQFDVIAFATHAVGEDPRFPEPGLLLTLQEEQAQGGDLRGFLTASEVLDLALDARLVILAGCETSAARTPREEVLSGLARSFFFAGARGLLVSHWPANEEATAQLMERFAAARTSARSDAEALRQAQLELLNPSWLDILWARVTRTSDPSYLSAPYYWAPFVSVGGLPGAAP